MRLTFAAASQITPSVNPLTGAMTCTNVGSSATTTTTNPGCEGSSAANGD
jgi:hypothetical protein